MKPPSQRLTRRVLDSLPLRMLHEARNWSKADVLIGEFPVGSGRQVVVKDLKRRTLWFRILAGRYLLRREWRALRVLEGTTGVPRAIARPDADSLVIEYVRGRPLLEMADCTLNDETMARLEHLVAELHRRGVTHGDLHHENILVDEAGNIALIDWATAHVFQGSGGAKQRLFEEWRALDLRAVAKIKLYHLRHRITDEDYKFLEAGSRAYRAVKKLRVVGEKLRGKKREGRLESAMKELKMQRAQEQENTAARQESSQDVSRS